MSELILHHYPNSPFAEKIRLILGFKKLAWKSVIIPAIMPKPDLVALTGGYRRTPVLQIGADIYCDTALIADVLEGLAPTPSLYPSALEGEARILAQWADTTLFWTAVAYAFQPAGMQAMFGGASPEVMQAFGADRAAMRGNAPRMSLAEASGQLQEILRRLENMLADGRPCLLGAEYCIADFSVLHSLWFVRRLPPLASVFDSSPRVQAWMDRMAGLGHHQFDKLKSEAALDIARASTPQTETATLVDLHGLALGSRVAISPTDYALDPVEGVLVCATANRLAVRRTDERAGEVVVHFPRCGYQMKAMLG